jgi:hypothetical protein
VPGSHAFCHAIWAAFSPNLTASIQGELSQACGSRECSQALVIDLVEPAQIEVFKPVHLCKTLHTYAPGRHCSLPN